MTQGGWDEGTRHEGTRDDEATRGGGRRGEGGRGRRGQVGVPTVVGVGAVIVLLGVGAGLLLDGEPETRSDSPVLLEAARSLGPERPARMVRDAEAGELVILHGPVDLPGSAASGEGGHGSAEGHGGPEGHGATEGGGGTEGHGAHGSDAAVFPTVSTVEVPASGVFYGFYADLATVEGEPVPSSLLHHVNIIDPDRRELFAPISLRVAAAGRETGYKGVPSLLFGSPLQAGQRLVVHTMLHNATDVDYEDVVLRFHFRFKPDEAAGPLVQAYPFWVDVRLPAGDKTFDLPPGRSTQTYEARPAVGGRLLALSGHMHRHATGLRFEDLTDGRTIWEAAPRTGPQGAILEVPTGYLFIRGGERIDPEHTYRLTVAYDNPTGATIADGGMGSIGGIVVPDEAAEWPQVDPADELYRLDRLHYFRERLGTLEELRAGPQGAEAQDSGSP